ncbi:hypothetical protein AU192_24745 [Mycobacterium lehmannii]|uniref:Helix-turn-helix domain-containing protein n=1 Tax=Mycobacterium lehmannii TaxID=2048550 RepID=A0A101A4J1_9MYCO|nr:helix-turn-helix domain-containing protein [Mycobacterium lehmannii]KUI13393.1 hypothetical protein AU192_24745 [Mycobacterium lehmannii]
MKKTTTTTPGWVDIKQAADYLSMGVPTIRRYIASGKLPARRVGPKLIRIRVSDLDKFVESGGSAA